MRYLRSSVALPMLAVAVIALAGCSGASSSPGPNSPSSLTDPNGTGAFQGIGLSPPEPRPSFTLTDTVGKPFAFGRQTAGHPTLLFFGYTKCPDVCPATMADANAAIKTLPVAFQATIDVVFVSTDVKQDTAAVIAQWLMNFSAGISAHVIGLRGTQAQIDAAQAAAHVTLAQDGGQLHSAQLLLFGADDYARVTYLPSSSESAQIAHDLPLVARR